MHSGNMLLALLRWVMRLDRPMPVLSEVEIEAQVERDYSWNFAVNVLDGGFWWFGYSLLSASTILPLFLSKLTSDPLAFGILAVISGAGWALPQLFVANAMERLPRMKPVVVNLGFFLERLPILVLVLCAALAVRAPRLAIVRLPAHLGLARLWQRCSRRFLAGPAGTHLPA